MNTQTWAKKAIKFGSEPGFFSLTTAGHLET